MFKETPDGETHSFGDKCGIEEHNPICFDCKKPLEPAYNETAKKITRQLWHCVSCYPNKLLSIG